MDQRLADLLALLELEQLEINLFRGESRDIGAPQVFGGQVLGQALSAAAATVEGRVVHSLHAYFLRRGDCNAPIVYQVDRSLDGHSFTNRRVVAIQHEQQRPFEFRMVQSFDYLHPRPAAPERQIWFRAVDALGDDEMLHRRLLAYVSDFFLLDTATLPHGTSILKPTLVMASIDHALWFHRTLRVDDWQLYAIESPSASGARGFARASVFARDGRLVASAAQEGLVRSR